MGKSTGFLEYERKAGRGKLLRIGLKTGMSFMLPKRGGTETPGARCMDCGVLFLSVRHDD